MGKKWPNTPDWWNEWKKITTNVKVKAAISETLGEGPGQELKNWAAKEVRKMIVNKGAEMSTISSENLQKKLLEAYEEWEFD